MTRALVLGGGGPVGIAWETGLIAGLAEAGVDLAQADYTLGTSAGSFVGSQLAMGRKVGDMAAAILAEADRPRPIPTGNAVRAEGGARPATSAMTVLFQKMQEAASGTRDPKEVRQEIGKFALEAETIDEPTFIKSFGRSLAESAPDAWPKRGYACTAVDAETGAFRLWDKAAGVGLTRAVASSCSVPGVYPPITIDGRRYIDGGMRSAVNADMARGHDLVVVVAIRVATGAGEAAERLRHALDAEIQVLKDGGSRVELIIPDDASVTAFGPNLMDMRRRPEAAQAGLDQGRGAAKALRSIWNG